MNEGQVTGAALGALWEEWQRLPIPVAVSDPVLCSVLDGILDLDAALAGAASTAVHGGRPRWRTCSDELARLERLARGRRESGEAEEIVAYVSTMRQVSLAVDAHLHGRAR